jgi:hypothetical protein
MIFECQPSHNLLKQLDIYDKKDERSNSEITDDSISTMIDSMPRLQIDIPVIHSHLSATSSSQRKNGHKPQSLHYSSSSNDNQQIPQLLYPYPNPTPYIPGQNYSADSPRTYVHAENPLNYTHPQYSRNPNQRSNGNIPVQYISQNHFPNDIMQQQYLKQ